mgnify:CR=1 FL=1
MLAETMKKPEGTDWYPELLARETTARENTPDNVVNIASKITLGEVVILPVNETPPKGAA